MRIVAVTLLSYCILISLFYLFQRNIVFKPDTSRAKRAEWFADDMSEIFFETEDGLKLYSWYKAAQNNRPTIVYFHGNADHLGSRVEHIRPFIDHGYGVLLVEYRGYGGNPGKASEQGVYEDARAALRWLRAQAPNSCVVLYGESLGTGVAAQMATEEEVKAIVLVSPYTSLVEVGQYHYPFLPNHWLLTERFESKRKLMKVKAPILIFQGLKDRVVPPKFSQSLYDALPGPKKMVTDPNAIHSNIQDIPMNVLDFLQDIACETKPAKASQQSAKS